MNKITIAIIVLMVGAVTAMTGYYAGQRRPSATTPTPSPDSPTPSPVIEGTSEPVSVPDQQTIQNSTRPPSSWVQGTVDPRPITTPPLATPVPTQQPGTNDISISFINTPSQVRSGQGFTVSWQVTGPAGRRGSTTGLAISYQVNKQSGGSSSSVNSNSSQSFGEFIVPKVFSTNLRYGGQAGVINVTASATVEGKVVSVDKAIQLVE